MGINFDLNDLQAFRAVVETGSFRKAAESVSISQPALSRRIDKLEEALGVRLFERTTRRVALTTVGRVFAQSAEQLLDDLDAALLGIRDVSSSRLGHVTIACAVGRLLLSAGHHRALSSALSAHPGQAAGRERERGAGRRHQRRSRFRRELHGQPGSRDRVQDAAPAVRRCVPPRPSLARKKRVTWNELYEHDYVSVDKTSGNRLLLEALAAVAPRGPSVRSAPRDDPARLDRGGLGVAAVPSMAMPGHDHPISRACRSSSRSSNGA